MARLTTPYPNADTMNFTCCVDNGDQMEVALYDTRPGDDHALTITLKPGPKSNDENKIALTLSDALDLADAIYARHGGVLTKLVRAAEEEE